MRHEITQPKIPQECTEKLVSVYRHDLSPVTLQASGPGQQHRWEYSSQYHVLVYSITMSHLDSDLF